MCEDGKGTRKSVDVTLGSGARARCWPEKLMRSVPMPPTPRGRKLRTANELKHDGTENINVGFGGDVHPRHQLCEGR